MLLSEPRIRAAHAVDAGALAHLYNHYIETSPVTFEEVPINLAEMQRRVQRVQDAALPWLVAERAGALLGYAYATPWKERAAYRYSVEISVYLAPGASGQGLGTALYRALFSELERRPVRAVLAGIVMPNPASVALHEKLGMRQVAELQAVGFKFGRWLDVGYWQRLLPGGGS